MTLRFRVLIEQDEDGVFVAECPNLPGCISQGKTRAEALENIRDAIQGYLASLEKHKEPVPPPIAEELVEIAVSFSAARVHPRWTAAKNLTQRQFTANSIRRQATRG